MGSRTFLLIAAVLLNPLPTHASAPSCEVRSSNDSQHIGPLRRQDGTGLCYAFTGLALVQEKYCRTRAAQGKPCRFDLQQDDRLSILDATALSNHGEGGIVSGGHTNDVLDAIQRARGLAPESCAPFDQMINRLWDGKSLVPEWKKAFNRAYQSVQGGQCTPDQKLQLASSLKELMQLRTSVDDIARALQLKDLSLALKGVVLPRECELRRVPLPPFEWKQKGSATPERLLSNLRELLAEGRSVGTDLCAYPATYRECGYHALTIRGAREVCCGKSCHWEYRIHDSADAFSRAETDRDGWLAEDKLLPRLDRYMKDAGHGRLYWIE